MPDLDRFLRPDISLAASQAVETCDFAIIERRASQRRRNRTVLAFTATAAAVAVALVGSLQIASSPRSAPNIPIQQPSPRSMPSTDAELEPGTYLVRSDESSAFDYTVTFPEDWHVQGGNEYYLNVDSPVGIGVLPYLIDEIYADACRGDRGSVTVVGPRPQDLVTALLAQQGPVKSAPVATTLGGYPATRIDLRVPKSLQAQDCFLGPGTGVQLWVSRPDRYLVLDSAGVVSVYVVDVDGRRQVFTAQYLSATSQQDRAQMQQVLDSIRIQK